MTKQEIIDAYVKIRTTDNTIPDNVLDFMKDCALEKIESIKIGDTTLIGNPLGLKESKMVNVWYHDDRDELFLITPKGFKMINGGSKKNLIADGLIPI